MYDSNRALELLRKGTSNRQALFREGQEDAIRNVVEGKDRILVVQKTGWGKSFVYFIATKVLREEGKGPALLISPLLSLMRNQILAADRMGVRALTLNSENTDDWESIEGRLERGDLDILLVSPERLDNERFKERVLSRMSASLSLLVIDEAHCISDWGHDFRPHYRLIERILRSLPPTLRVLATTATANERVLDDLVEILGKDTYVIRGPLSRPSLTLQTIRMQSQAERLAWLAEQIPRLPGSGIVYTLTVRDAVAVADWLRFRGIVVASYSADSGDARPGLEQALLDNRVKALVSTTALGMGFDKPDVAFVIHYQSPASVVAYYQQVGRAGRALENAYGVLLSGEEEAEINDYFITSAFPTPDEVEDILRELEEAPGGLTISQLLARLNITRGRIDKTLQLLSLESPSPIVKDGTKWQLTTAKLGQGFWERAKRLTALRKVEQAQMAEYVKLESGHMDFLIQALDGIDEAQPSRQARLLPTSIDPRIAREAVAWLRRIHVDIEPRKKWPDGGLPLYGVRGNISEDRRASRGKSLCHWGDVGWGELVKSGKYTTRRFDDELVEACAEMVTAWRPSPFPTWVTSIPSLRDPFLVRDFSDRLARRLGIEYRAALLKTVECPAQKLMANSVQQARNVDGVFAVVAEEVLAGPVLLVDDIVDSRWTFTVTSWLLRKGGVAAVHPLTLAFAENGT